MDKRIKTRIKEQMEKTQKEYYLNEQMRAIKKEMGAEDDSGDEVREIEEKLKTKKMSKEATEKVEHELKKLKMMTPMSAEATVVRNYIDWILSLPWQEKTELVADDLKKAEQILEEDHYGLEKPKERILEYLAVQALVKKMRAPSCASSARPASARPRSPSPSRAPPAASSSGCPWAGCATRPRSAATGAPTSGRCPARSSSR